VQHRRPSITTHMATAFERVVSDEGVLKRVLKAGRRDKAVPEGVCVDEKLPVGAVVRLTYYEGCLNASGKIFDSAKCFSFVVGRSEVISGFEEACSSMRYPGETAEFIIRFDHAYGVRGFAQGGIPPRADLRFKIELETILPPSLTGESKSQTERLAIEDKDAVEARKRRTRTIERKPDPEPTRTVNVGGEPVSIDALGPLVINVDGTLSRITNWNEMTPDEQSRTIRIIGKRNRKRREKLSRRV